MNSLLSARIARVTAALAAGCSVIARPASEAPGSCMVLAQALAIGLAGSGLAILVGLALCVAFTEGFTPAVIGWDLEFRPSVGVAFLGAGLGTLACVLGAAVPAERAARLSPAVALRYE